MPDRIRLADIELNGGTQTRAKIDRDTVADYGNAMIDGAEFPPIIVYYDGLAYWLADGFHRVAAARMCEWKEIDAEVRQGTCRDAILHSVGANAQHGLRRTNTDKQRAVETLINDDEWGRWSNCEIARRCGVSEFLVRKFRPTSIKSKLDRNTECAYTTKHGSPATMNTANIGKAPKAAETIWVPWPPVEDAAAVPQPSLVTPPTVTSAEVLDTDTGEVRTVPAAVAYDAEVRTLMVPEPMTADESMAGAQWITHATGRATELAAYLQISFTRAMGLALAESLRDGRVLLP